VVATHLDERALHLLDACRRPGKARTQLFHFTVARRSSLSNCLISAASCLGSCSSLARCRVCSRLGVSGIWMMSFSSCAFRWRLRSSSARKPPGRTPGSVPYPQWCGADPAGYRATARPP
jgi:hypothetical protein